MSEFQVSTAELVANFYADLTESAGSTITSGVSQFQNELLLLARNRKLNQVRSEEVEIACGRLEAILASQFQKNMTKFKLYCDRNIFVPRVSSQEADENSMVGSNASSAQIDSALQEATDEVEALRSRYLAQLQVYRTLSAECNDSALLLKDMRNALYNLKLSANTDEDFVLRSSSASLIDLHRSLHNITDNASALLYEIQTTVSTASDTNKAPGPYTSHEINVKGASDIHALRMALQ